MMDNLECQHERKNPFLVPESYFRGLEDQVMDRIKRERGAKSDQWMRVLRPYLNIGAVLLVFIVVYWIVPRFVPVQGEHVLENLEEEYFELDMDFNPTREEIIEYLAQEVDASDFFFDWKRL